MIKCNLEYQNDKLKIKTIYLPALPVIGKDNFDIIVDGEAYNFHVISVDFCIIDDHFDYCTIYLTND